MSASHETAPEARIDRWLWASRIFKTRSLATRACRNGRVRLNNRTAKASQPVSTGDEIEVRMPPIDRRWRVLAPAVKRVSARLARDLAMEITPPGELEKLEKFRRDPAGFILGRREPGSGRPTKRERRQVEKLRGED